MRKILCPGWIKMKKYNAKKIDAIKNRKGNGAGEGIRTLDHHVGNVMLYH